MNITANSIECFWNILCAIGLTSAAAMSVFYRIKILTFSLYVYTTISMS
jgi:hypothetical protein